MMNRTSFTTWLDRHRDLGVLALRLFVGARLVYGVLDNVISGEHMREFEQFLTQFHFPWPAVAAPLSVYAQLLTGLAILLGWQTRLAALLMMVNFAVALLMVHRQDTVEGATPALALFFCCVLLFFQGAGRFAMDKAAG